MVSLHPRRMTILSLAVIAGIFIAATAARADGKFEVIERTEKGKAIHAFVDLPGLIRPDFAETADFKVVQATGDDAIEWAKASPADRLRAANVIYHLTIAKNYFISELHSENVMKMEQIVVRLNITNKFSPAGHFQNAELDPQTNTAYSVPAGHGNTVIRQDPNDPNSPVIARPEISWNREMFLDPPKPIPIQVLLDKMTADPLDPTISEMRKVVYPTEINQASGNAAKYLFTSNAQNSDFVNACTRQAGTLALIEGSFLLMKEINRLLLPKFYYLDTAMVPEILYHEFTHLALSDFMAPNHKAPVVEGMADYFAAVIANSPKLAKNIKEYSTALAKDGSKVKDFAVSYELDTQATADYVLSLLWGMRKVIGEQETTRLIWATRTELDSFNSGIRTQLMAGLENQCHTVCRNPGLDLLSLNLYFQGKAADSKKAPKKP